MKVFCENCGESFLSFDVDGSGVCPTCRVESGEFDEDD